MCRRMHVARRNMHARTHQRDLEPALNEVLRHLDADEPASHHDGRLDIVLVDPVPDEARVGDRALQADQGKRGGGVRWHLG